MKFATFAAFMPVAAQAQFGGRGGFGGFGGFGGYGGQSLYGFRGGFQPAFGGFGGQYSFNNNFGQGLAPQQTVQLHMAAAPAQSPQTTVASSIPQLQFSAYGGPSQFTQGYSNFARFTPQALGHGMQPGFNGGGPFNMFGSSAGFGANTFGQQATAPFGNAFGLQFNQGLTQLPSGSTGTVQFPPTTGTVQFPPTTGTAPTVPVTPPASQPALPVEPVTPAPPVLTLSSIVEMGAASPDHKTMIAILSDPRYADILDTLNGDGPFTVFAPTDEAFAAAGLTPSTFGDAPSEVISAVLTFHVVASKVTYEDLAAGENVVETLNGASLTVTKNADGTVTIANGDAGTVGVTAGDLEASNGVIHVIDALLRPPAPAAAPATEAPAEPTSGGGRKGKKGR